MELLVVFIVSVKLRKIHRVGKALNDTLTSYISPFTNRLLKSPLFNQRAFEKRLSKSKHMLSPTLEITKGAVRSLKTVCKELRKTGRVFQKHKQEPPPLSHLGTLRTLPFFQQWLSFR